MNTYCQVVIEQQRHEKSCPAGTAAPAWLSTPLGSRPRSPPPKEGHEKNGHKNHPRSRSRSRAKLLDHSSTIPPHPPLVKRLRRSAPASLLAPAIYPTAAPSALKPLALRPLHYTALLPPAAALRPLLRTSCCPRARCSLGPSLGPWRRLCWGRCAAAEAGPTRPSGAPTVATHGES